MNFYIDGYNLYYSLRNNAMYNLLWLDIEKFCSKFLITNQELNRIYFFTSTWQEKPESEKRANNYYSAIKAVSGEKFKVIKGKFSQKEHKCMNCNYEKAFVEEKWTDVNVSVKMLMGAFKQEYDIAYLISADSDYVPLVETLVGELDKDIRVLFPPNLYSEDLKKRARESKDISPNWFRECQLPEVVKAYDKEFRKPDEWSMPFPLNHYK